MLHKKGHWALPKGHPEPGESPIHTACRELKEETNLKVVKFLSYKISDLSSGNQNICTDEFEENYSFQKDGKSVKKKVVYYLAEVEGVVKLQEDEIEDYCWVSLEDAVGKVTFPSSKETIMKVQFFFQTRVIVD